MLIRAASWVACHLPERVAVAVADVAGGVWYRVTPARAEQARRNFARLAAHLDAEGRGPDRARAAARDSRELERLVRLAFRHDARYYLEILRLPGLGPAFLDERVVVETPAEIDEAFSGGPVIFVSAHFGPIELPALYLAHRSGSTFVAPMETVDDPPLQTWFEETRGSLGVRIVGLRSARRELSAALKARRLRGDRRRPGHRRRRDRGAVLRLARRRSRSGRRCWPWRPGRGSPRSASGGCPTAASPVA